MVLHVSVAVKGEQPKGKRLKMVNKLLAKKMLQKLRILLPPQLTQLLKKQNKWLIVNLLLKKK